MQNKFLTSENRNFTQSWKTKIELLKFVICQEKISIQTTSLSGNEKKFNLFAFFFSYFLQIVSPGYCEQAASWK